MQAKTTCATVLLAVIPLGVTACAPSTCGERDGTVSYSGSEQYVGTITSARFSGGVAGSTSGSATVDWNPYVRRSEGLSDSVCSTSDVPLQVTLAGCVLGGTLTSTTFESGPYSTLAFISASASISPGQTCEIPISSGAGGSDDYVATVVIDRGQVDWDDPTSMTVVISGTVTTSSLAAPQLSGYITYTFKGTH